VRIQRVKPGGDAVKCLANDLTAGDFADEAAHSGPGQAGCASHPGSDPVSVARGQRRNKPLQRCSQPFALVPRKGSAYPVGSQSFVVRTASNADLGIPYRHPERDTCVPKRLVQIRRAPVVENFVLRGDYQDRMSLAQQFMRYPSRIIVIVF